MLNLSSGWLFECQCRARACLATVATWLAEPCGTITHSTANRMPDLLSMSMHAGMLTAKRMGPRRGRSHDSLRTIPIHMQEPGVEGFGQQGAPGLGPSSTIPGPQDGALPAAPGSRPAGPGPSFTYAEDDFPSLAAAKGPSNKGPAGKPGKGASSSQGLGRSGAGASHAGVSRPASEPDLSSCS